MDSLSSCYFCGTAIDEPLATYLVGDQDPGTSVTLCPGCHRKLETVLDAVDAGGAALPTAESAGVAADTDQPSPEPPDGPAAPDEPEDDPLGTGSDASDILVDPGLDGPIDGHSGPDDRASGSSVEPEPDDEPATETRETIEDTETGADERAPEDRATVEEKDRGTPEETIDGDTPDEEEEETIDESSPESQAGDPAGQSEDGGGGETQTGRTARRSVSALEYNKVMRLLQNREFPVDRDEIETIATSAYDLTRSECAAVIDIAVDRDLIDEESGQLLRPEQ